MSNKVVPTAIASQVEKLEAVPLKFLNLIVPNCSKSSYCIKIPVLERTLQS